MVDAAVQLKTYVDTNYQLPSTVSVAGKDVSMYTFLYLLTTVVQNINTNNNNPVDTITYNGPQIVKDETHTGNMLLSEYIKIADQIKVYMDQTRVTPGYAYQTSLGPYFSYQNMIYTYSNILATYNTSKTLPNTIPIKPWASISDPTFTNQQVMDAAVQLKTYVDTNKQLPSSVSVAGKDVSMYTFLYLLTTVVQNINTNNNNPVDAISYNGPQIVKDEIHSGNMLLSEYIKIADQIKVYMDQTRVTPGYAGQTSVGPYFSYQNMIYTYSNILATYNTSKTLPNTIPIKPWNSFSTQQIAAAASEVTTFVGTNHRLPNYVTINGVNVGMSSFLEILSKTVLNINSGTNNLVEFNYCSTAPYVQEQIQNGNLNKNEYIQIAGDIKSYMDSTWIAPGYAYNTSLGVYLGYYNLLYTYSQVLNYYNQNKALPDSVSVQPWGYVLIPELSKNVPSDLIPYTWATNNCQSTDPAITSLAYSLASGANSAWDVGVNIFNWVRDNVGYSFYYNTKYGAVGALNAKTGNCCDTANLLIALARAVGIPAQYVHTNSYFTTSGTWYGHVWAQLYINGQWIWADATSSRNSFGVINNWNTKTYTVKGIYRELPF